MNEELLPIDVEANDKYNYVDLRFTPAMARELAATLLREADAADAEQNTREKELPARFHDSIEPDLMGSRRTRKGKFTVLVRKEQLE